MRKFICVVAACGMLAGCASKGLFGENGPAVPMPTLVTDYGTFELTPDGKTSGTLNMPAPVIDLRRGNNPK